MKSGYVIIALYVLLVLTLSVVQAWPEIRTAKLPKKDL